MLLSILTKVQVITVIFLLHMQSLFTYLVKRTMEIFNMQTQGYTKHSDK